MASDDSSAGSGAGSGGSGEWSSLLRGAEPDDVEDVALSIALRRSLLEQADNIITDSITHVTRQPSADSLGLHGFGVSDMRNTAVGANI